jgi:hypothetical protein
LIARPRLAPAQGRLSSALWSVWLAPDRHAPIPCGKHRSAKLRGRTVGLPVFLVDGATLGWFSLCAAVRRGADSVAFEPSPRELERARLVKIDVEGWEMEVLEGMKESLPLLRRAAIVVEVTPGWPETNGSSARELYRFLESAG